MFLAQVETTNPDDMGKIIDSIERGTEVMDKRGATSVITVLVISFIAYVAWRTYTDWRSFRAKEIEDEREYKKQKLEDDMEMSRKSTEADLELKRELTKAVSGLTTSVSSNTQAIDRTESKLDLHDDSAMGEFKALNEKLDDISTKMEIAFDKSNEIETKTMLNEMNKEIKSLSDSIRDAKGEKNEQG